MKKTVLTILVLLGSLAQAKQKKWTVSDPAIGSAEVIINYRRAPHESEEKYLSVKVACPGGKLEQIPFPTEKGTVKELKVCLFVPPFDEQKTTSLEDIESTEYKLAFTADKKLVLNYVVNNAAIEIFQGQRMCNLDRSREIDFKPCFEDAK